MFSASSSPEEPALNSFSGSFCDTSGVNQSYKHHCEKSSIYLTQIIQNGSLNRIPSCIYLYYWIYKDVMQKNRNSNEILNVYQSFVEAYDLTGNVSDMCNEYTEYINVDKFYKIEKLIELHGNFDKFEKSSGPRKHTDCVHAKECHDSYVSYAKEFVKDGWDDFCVELENFKERYDNVMHTVTICGEDIPRTLPSIKGSNTVSISVSFAMVLLIPLISFTLYKFNLLPTWIQNRIRSKKITHDYIHQGEQQFIEVYEGSEANLNDKQYNLAYQSVEY